MEITTHIPLAVIIVTYKNENVTIDFVKDQVSKIITLHKVVIVNNGATAESNNKYVKGLNAKVIDNVNSTIEDKEHLVFVINNHENSGFAIGNNMGAIFAQRNFNPSYFLFTNNDIRLTNKDVVEKLIGKLGQHPEVGIIGPMVRGLNGDYQSPEPYLSFADRYIWLYLSTLFLSKEKKMRRFHLDYAKKAEEGYHYRVMGSFFMTPSKAFFECGMMDEHTFLFAEEMILSERMAAIGKKVYYDPSVYVIHAHGTTIKSKYSINRIKRIQFDSNAYYYNKYRHVSKMEILIGRLIMNIIFLFKK